MMTIGTTLNAVEKRFGPALAGTGPEDTTFSAIRIGKGKKFGGVPGRRDDAVFYLHFPLPVDWAQLTTRKGTPDFINNLSTAGPQGEQGRPAQVAAFLESYKKDEQARRAKAEAKEKKQEAAARKERFRAVREQLAAYAGERLVIVEIAGARFEIPLTIKVDKAGKVKLSGAI